VDAKTEKAVSYATVEILTLNNAVVTSLSGRGLGFTRLGPSPLNNHTVAVHDRDHFFLNELVCDSGRQ
jgi:hypothetical protein